MTSYLVEFVKGSNAKFLNQYLATYRSKKLKKQLQCLITDSTVRTNISSLLNALCIDSAEQNKYFASPLTIHELLLQLNKEGHIQIAYILDAIDKQFSLGLQLSIGGIIFLIYTLLLLLTPPFTFIFASIKSFVTAPIGLPIIGIVLTIAGVGGKLYQLAADKRSTNFRRIFELFFLIAYAAFSLAGSGCWLAAHLAMTPLAASLFIISVSLDIVKELIFLGQEYRHYKNNPPNCAEPLNQSLILARHKFNYKKHSHAALINLAVALLVVGIVIAWCVAPANIAVSAVGCASLLIVMIFKKLITNYSEKRIRDRLQRNIGLEYEIIHHQKASNSENLKTVQVAKDNNEEALRETFISNYCKRLSVEQRYGFFSGYRQGLLNINNTTLSGIYRHAFYEKGKRSRKLLIDLEWVNEQGEQVLPNKALEKAIEDAQTSAPVPAFY